MTTDIPWPFVLEAVVIKKFLLLSCLLLSAVIAAADRAPVLPQIDVPHAYYFREMYLPQLTTGPSSLAWSPDGRELVYSMQGSLWRQSVDSGLAFQLTAGPGYDYQPDWSPDGQRIIFVRYNRDAIELQLLDLATGKVSALTNGGAVNVEPRWSPDGDRIAFVSTRDRGRFHVFTGTVESGRLTASAVFKERKSKISRYYYSEYDHELSPAWSPDGKSILYVGNPEIPYGTGAIWRKTLGNDSQPRLVRKEETTWKARPDWSPDGKRIIYSSYLGRQWHQLWITTPDGIAEPFPLTYGEFDITAARWSPDAGRIAYISNETGNTGIRIQDFVGGKSITLTVSERKYIRPMLPIKLRVLDANGEPTPARVAVVGSDGRSYAPPSRWMHADDGFDRDRAGFETQYFHSDGDDTILVPPGATQVTVWRGLEHAIGKTVVNVAKGRDNLLVTTPERLDLPQGWRNWVSGDVHVHMNYGGAYRNTPKRLVHQAAAEDLDVVFNLIVNKEQRIPDIAYYSSKPDSASTPATLLLHSQEFHTSFWGHLGLIGLQSHLLMPDYSAYPYTGAGSLYPDNATIARLARQQGAAVGYVHPFLSPPPNPKTDKKLTNALPVDAALGLVDYYEVVGFADHRASAEVWYGLLNCGIHIAAAGGTDAMGNYASLRGPLGVNRAYVRVAGKAKTAADRRAEWLIGLKAGHSIATNGPLLGLTVNHKGPGDTISLRSGEHELEFSGFLRSVVPVDHLELVHNGKVIRTFDVTGRNANVQGSVTVQNSGWLLLRAWNDNAEPLVFDLYPYATTSPVYLSVNNRRPRSTDDAEYFLAWIGRIREAVGTYESFNADFERQAILKNLDDAEQVYEACR